MNLNKREHPPILLLWFLILFAIPTWIAVAIGQNQLWIAVVASVIGTAYGMILYQIRLPTWLNGPALLLILAVFAVLATRGRPIGFLCINWLAGPFTGANLGKYLWGPPVGSQDRAQIIPGWHINGTKCLSELAARKARAELSRLDGKNHFVMTIMNESARLDAVGTGDGGVVVYCSADVHLPQNWSLLLDPTKSSSLVDLSLGPDEARLPEDHVVSLALATRATDAFIAERVPDPELKWLSGNEAFYRRPPSLG